MLGAVFSTILIKLVFNTDYVVPRFYTSTAELFLGISLGLNITTSLFTDLGKYLPVIILFIFLSLVSSILCGIYLHWKKQIDLPTALYSMVPGAAFQMIVLGKQQGASVEIIGSIHILRMLLVIIIPILIGSFVKANAIAIEPSPLLDFGLDVEHLLVIGAVMLGSFIMFKLRIPINIIIGSMTAVAIIQFIYGEVTPLGGSYMSLTQIIIGVTVGSSISRSTITALRDIIIPVFLTVIILIAFNIGLSWIFTIIGHGNFISALFSFAPGGLTEMTVAAKSLGGDEVLVASIHIIRLLLIILFVPAFIKWLIRKRQ